MESPGTRFCDVYRMKNRSRFRLLIAALLWAISLLSTGCENLDEPKGTPWIGAVLISFPPGSVPAGFLGAAAFIFDDWDGSTIGCATASINGKELIFDPSALCYVGDVFVQPGETVKLAVSVGDKEYTATGAQFTSYPVISQPVPGDAWARATSHSVSWSGGTPTANALSYDLGVLDAADPNGPLVWPSNGIMDLSLGTTSYWIPSNSLTAGDRLVMVGIVGAVDIPSASPGSHMVISGFTAVPVAVVAGSELASITVSPGNLALPIGRTTQFAAKGMSGDGSWSDVTGSATWSSVDTGIATISNETGSAGLAETIGAGTTEITSAVGTIWGSTTLTVRPWKQEDSGTNSALYDVVWSGTQFVAVGDGGVVLTSPDGTTWTQRVSGTSARLYGIAWSGAQFVATGSGGIYTSPDGVSWTEQLGFPASGLDVVWSGTQFVVVGGDIFTSPDGVNWTSQGSAQLYSVAWSGSQFAAVGAYGKIITSPDGVTWTDQTSGTSSYLTGVTWSGSKFVAVGSYDSSIGEGPTVSSSDGVNWTLHASGATDFLNAVAWSGTQFVAVGENGNILLSTDGNMWTSQSIVSSRYGEHLNGVAWSGGRFIAVGNYGIILTTVSGQSQKQQSIMKAAGPPGQQRGALQGVFWGARGNSR
jgi:hypothetical protein